MKLHKDAAVNTDRAKNKVAGKKPRSGKVETVKVDKRVMRAALKAAKREARLLKIESRIRVRVKDARYDPPR